MERENASLFADGIRVRAGGGPNMVRCPAITTATAATTSPRTIVSRAIGTAGMPPAILCAPIIYGASWGGLGLQAVGALLDMPPQLVVYDFGGAVHAWNNALPFELRPSSSWSPVLHVLLGPQYRDLISTCNYSLGGKWYRYQYKMDAYIVDPATGAILRHEELKGSRPSSCPYIIFGGGGSSTGSQISTADFVAWVRQFTDW